MDPTGGWGHMGGAAAHHDQVGPIIFTQSQIEACLLRGLSKWEIVAELQNNNQIKQTVTLDVWAKLEQQNQPFFDAYDQFIRLRNQCLDVNDILNKLDDSNGAKDATATGSSNNGSGSARSNSANHQGGADAQGTSRGRTGSSRDDGSGSTISAQNRLSPEFET